MKKGQRMSQEQKDKISKKLKGHSSFMNGYKHSQEIRDRISKGKKGKHTSLKTEFKKGHKQIPNSGSFKKGQTLGSKNANWKGGKIIHNGYVFLLQPSHPFCNSQGYVRRSRLVMEKHLKRYLKPEETMHHKNRIKDDDRLKNLHLFANRSKHAKFHKS